MVTMLSNAPCAAVGIVASNAITEIINPSVVPGININSIPPSTLCAGIPTNFITNIVSGSTTPQYTWYENGAVLSDATSSSYLELNPTNGDTVQVLISSIDCTAIPLTYSNKMGITVLLFTSSLASVRATFPFYDPYRKGIVFSIN